ncbi:MAG: signal recognition particle-docking protein FtsY [Cardiobacteriaceae bacterium]|nr:signal recognition particle-docking protein FtsY [Cardiobacteriaceae bacterium]
MAFNWFRKNKTEKNSAQEQAQNPEVQNQEYSEKDAPKPQEESGYLSRLKQGLSKTSNAFSGFFRQRQEIDDSLLEDLEMLLLSADVGVEGTKKILDELKGQIANKEISDANQVRSTLADYMHSLLAPYETKIDTAKAKPFVILMIGINGAGKTTTIGKLAAKYKSEGKKVMLAAADTFRAAAVEQLQSWGEKNSVPVIAQKTGADAASVAYDALEAAKARECDVLIVDTAGRLHTQNHLMEELKKVKRVLQKLDADVPHQTLIVIDAGNGQNSLRQAKEFHQAMGIDGVVITKLDGTAKGGSLFAVTEQLRLPVCFIGVGEKIEDLREFNARDFVEAMIYND